MLTPTQLREKYGDRWWDETLPCEKCGEEIGKQKVAFSRKNYDKNPRYCVPCGKAERKFYHNNP